MTIIFYDSINYVGTYDDVGDRQEKYDLDAKTIIYS